MFGGQTQLQTYGLLWSTSSGTVVNCYMGGCSGCRLSGTTILWIFPEHTTTAADDTDKTDDEKNNTPYGDGDRSSYSQGEELT